MWLAALVAASLACGGRLRQPTATPPAVNLVTAQPGTAASLPTEALVPGTTAPQATGAQSPTLAATDTAPPAATAAPTETPAPQVDTQGDLLENMLGQLDATNTAAQSDLDKIPANP